MQTYTLTANTAFTADGIPFAAGDTIAVIDSPLDPGSVCSVLMARHVSVNSIVLGDVVEVEGVVATRLVTGTDPAGGAPSEPQAADQPPDTPSPTGTGIGDPDPDDRDLADLTTSRRSDTLADAGMFTVGDLRQWIADGGTLEDLPGFGKTDDAALRKLL